MDNRRLDLWTWCSWLLFGWCIFHFIVQLIFEIHACCYARQDYERESPTPRFEPTFEPRLGFEDADYYPEKNPDPRVRRERVPVRHAWRTFSRLGSPLVLGRSMETSPTEHLRLRYVDRGHRSRSRYHFLSRLLSKSENEVHERSPDILQQPLAFLSFVFVMLACLFYITFKQ